MEYGLIDDKHIEELADRLTAHGFEALTPNDWPILVIAMEALSARRGNEAERDALRAEIERLRDELWQHTEAAKQSLKEKEALRAELAAGRDWLQARAGVLEDWANTKAELAAEREKNRPNSEKESS